MIKKKSIILTLIVWLALIPSMTLAKPNFSYSITPVSNITSSSSVKSKTQTQTSPKADTPADKTIQGSVSVDIHPYCQNWTSEEAFNVINHIGTKLVQSNGIEKNIQFVVSDNDEANASTDVHNKIEVNSGLLKYVETEDELAFVIGHEMGHVSKNHVKKTIIRNGISATTGVAGSVLITLGSLSNSSSMIKSGAILAGTSAADTLVNKKLSRGQETTSDLTSIDYMVKAGYNPLATISMLNKISGNYFDLFSDHPSGEKRIKKAYQYIKVNYPDYIQKGYNTASYERALTIINNEK